MATRILVVKTSITVSSIISSSSRSVKASISKDNAALQRLKDEAEKAKRAQLDTASRYQSAIFSQLMLMVQNTSVHTHPVPNLKTSSKTSSTRRLFHAKKSLKDAGLKASDIDEIVLVGGMTRMPAVVEKVKQIFGKDPMQGRQPRRSGRDRRSDSGGGVLAGDVKDVLLLDVTPLSNSIETMGGVTTKLIEPV